MFGYSAWDQPPPHVPAHTVHVSTAALLIGGSCYMVSHFARLAASARTGSYDWPLLAMSLNCGWELVMGYMAPAPHERAGSLAWGFLSLYAIVKMLQRGGQREWSHAPHVGRNIFTIFWTMLTVCSVGMWAFIRWFEQNQIGAGRPGRTGPNEADWAELSWWTALGVQSMTIISQFALLLTRGSTRGTGRKVWAWHGTGTLIGLYGNFFWRAYFWPEAHPYITSPLSLWLFSVAFATDYIAYPLLWKHIAAGEDAGVKMQQAKKSSKPNYFRATNGA